MLLWCTPSSIRSSRWGQIFTSPRSILLMLQPYHLLCVLCLYLQVFKEYFKELEEESIRDNFVTVYELMDEVMDFGFPQTTDSKILQE